MNPNKPVAANENWGSQSCRRRWVACARFYAAFTEPAYHGGISVYSSRANY